MLRLALVQIPIHEILYCDLELFTVNGGRGEVGHVILNELSYIFDYSH